MTTERPPHVLKIFREEILAGLEDKTCPEVIAMTEYLNGLNDNQLQVFVQNFVKTMQSFKE